eukprot:112644-Rhodomonas_salina.1
MTIQKVSTSTRLVRWYPAVAPSIQTQDCHQDCCPASETYKGRDCDTVLLLVNLHTAYTSDSQQQKRQQCQRTYCTRVRCR